MPIGEDELLIGIADDEQIPSGLVDEFVAAFTEHAISVQRERRPTEVYAGIEVYLPSLVMLFVTRKLFDSFMSEAGKDLYNFTKIAVQRLVRRTTGPTRELNAVTVVSAQTPNKGTAGSAAIFSCYALLLNGTRAKFLFTNDLSRHTQELAVVSMLELLQRHYLGDSRETYGLLTDGSSALWTTLPLRFDPVSKHWRRITPGEAN